MIEKQSDTSILLKSIDKFLLWCDNNGLSVNAMKCKVKKITLNTDYFIKGEMIKITSIIRDLRVMLDSEYILA